jgi:asparagine synthase (glutamine-hydrolysing)
VWAPRYACPEFTPDVCGIAGVADLAGLASSDVALVDAMLRTLVHRGPDDLYTISDSHVAMGARRLAIIDLDAGRQPLSNEDGTVWVTQNGEIYDYVELRADLASRGHVLKTKGDTEAVVHAYEEFGERFPEKLRGMFAVALWDARQERLVLARDRLGKKPLYWRLADGRLSYGSELKALLADPTMPREIDREALALYLQYQYIPAPRTIFKGVYKLPPASVLVWAGGEPRITRYWSPAYEPKIRRTRREDVEECLRLLRESVRLRLRSDVPVGVFLSGGMDSSVVTALMVEASERPVRTFSIGFAEDEYNELPYARAVATHLGTDHTDDIVTIDAVELLPKLGHHYDEPFGDPSAMPTFRVAQLAGAELKVVLTGDGGDESFGGYTRYQFQHTMHLLTRMPGSRVMAETAQWVLSRSPVSERTRRRAALWRQLERMGPDERYVGLMSIISPAMIHGLLGGYEHSDQSAYLEEALRAGPSDPLDRLLRADLHTYLPEDLLVKMDRATMANSLEARAPLLDHKVVEFAASLPSDRKIHRGVTKVILRTAAKTLLPANLIDRPKMGFGIPLHEWFRGSLGDVFADLVLAHDSAIRDHMDQRVAATLLHEHRTGPLTHGYRLWELLMFEQWARTWMRSDIAAAA